jgi:hypothetical protein
MSSNRIDLMLRDVLLLDVMRGALRLWGVTGTVEADRDAFIVTAGGRALRISRSGSGLEVTHADAAIQDLTPVRCAGVPGLLRHLRDELAPHAQRGRLIIGAQ